MPITCLPPLRPWLLLCCALLYWASPHAEAHSASPDTLWFDGFEGDWTDHWFADAGTWQVGMPTSGPHETHSGTAVGATALDGNYAGTVNSRLIRSTAFQIPSDAEHPRLRFWHWYSFSRSDYGVVQVSVDGGSTWDEVTPWYTSTGSGVWTYPSVDLSAYTGMTIQIAFYAVARCYWGDCSDVSSGWYVDDVSVITGATQFVNPERFEAGLGDWFAERGTWEVGVPESGPAACYSPSSCAGTALAGNYAGTVSSRLISPPIRILPESRDLRLAFWHWYSFDRSDYGELQVSADSGRTWTPLSGRFTSTSSNAWTFFQAPLPDSARVLLVAFHFAASCYWGD